MSKKKTLGLLFLASFLGCVGSLAHAELVGYWPLDGDANDLSPSGINGMVVGEASFSDEVPAAIGGGQSILVNPDGVVEPGYVDLGNPDVLNFADNNWTISAWMRTIEDGLSERGNIFSNGGDNGGGVRYVLAFIENGGQAIVLTTDDDTDKRQAQASAGDFTVDDMEWHHVVGLREDEELRVYIDGELAGENFDVPDGYDLSGTDQQNVYIGVGIDANGDPDDPEFSLEKSFQGWIDEVAVWNEALSEADILSLYNGDISKWVGGGVTGDFNGNEVLDVDDINLLAAASASGQNEATFDLNGDGAVNGLDVNEWIKNISNSWIGDANVDGEFNSGDFVAVFTSGKFETGDTASWAEGDWNGDGKFDSGDFVAAFTDGGFEMGPRPAAAASVPEPSSLFLVALGTLCLFKVRRRR